MRASLPRPISSIELLQEIQTRVPEIEIRDEQVQALDALQDSEEDGSGRALIVMAPGLGKTTVMAAHARRRLLHDPSRRGIVLNDNNEILAQTHDRFQTIVGPEFSYGLFNGYGRDYSELSILFGSFQVMRNWHPAFLRDEFDFGTVDESHHGKAPTYQPVIDYFNFNHLSGFTATPDRMDIKDIRHIFGNERFSIPLEEAIAKRKLASVDYWLITDEVVDTGELMDEEGYVYSRSALDRTIFVPRRDGEITRIINEHAESLPRVKRLIFCSTIEQAERYATFFENAAPFHSGLPIKMRRQHLQHFKDNQLSTLTTVDAMNEGIDIPEATQIVFLRSTDSKRVFLQQLGRGLRKTPTKKRVQVLDFAGNCDHLLLVDRVWREIAAKGDTNIREDGTEMLEVATSSIHFNESSRRILPILRRISQRVYRPDQVVEEGSVRLSSLADSLNMTPAALKTIADSISVPLQTFPTHAGNKLPYLLPEDAERLTTAVQRIFRLRK